jgi:hypothetical protein
MGRSPPSGQAPSQMQILLAATAEHHAAKPGRITAAQVVKFELAPSTALLAAIVSAQQGRLLNRVGEFAPAVPAAHRDALGDLSIPATTKTQGGHRNCHQTVREFGSHR